MNFVLVEENDLRKLLSHARAGVDHVYPVFSNEKLEPANRYNLIKRQNILDIVIKYESELKNLRYKNEQAES